MRLGVICAATAAVSIFLASQTEAHHSFAAYDLSWIVTVNGTVKEFRWGAPHAALLIVYKNDKGQAVDLMVQSGSPAAFSRQGFNPNDFKAGQKVELSYHPNRNGSLGGAMSTLRLTDGRIFKDAEVSDPASGANVPPGGPASPPASGQ